MSSAPFDLLRSCEVAIRAKVPTSRQRDDKEFHFQRWVESRIEDAGYDCPESGRNTYPDFPLDSEPIAFEVKGITVGSRESDFDCNSQLPLGKHDGRDVLYIFGRYGNQNTETLVQDIAIVHGDLLNPSPLKLGKNKSLRAAGGYGDVLLRVRKMFAPYTPYKLLTGLRGNCTLVLPSEWETTPSGFKPVGDFRRVETHQIASGFREDLDRDTLQLATRPNPSAGKVHSFRAWRTADAADEKVELVDAVDSTGDRA